MIEEIWRQIPGFPDQEVSNLGNGRTWRNKNGVGRSTSPRPLKAWPIKGKNYSHFRLSGGKYKKVHIAVLEAFVGPRPAGHDGCHNDGDATNNWLSNLRWGTKKSNAADRIAHGTQIRGEEISIAILTEDQVREVKAAIPTWKHGTGRYFAKKFGVGDSAISAIKNGLTWSHI